jgi:hypothetical protein
MRGRCPRQFGRNGEGDNKIPLYSKTIFFCIIVVSFLLVSTFIDTGGQSVLGNTDNGSVDIWPAQLGDCNGDGVVDAGDISALLQEIFDEDGDLPGDTPGGLFPGNPLGCDANGDGVIDAGEISCASLIIFKGSGSCSVSKSSPLSFSSNDSLLTTATTGPALDIPDQIPASPGGTVTVPVNYTANGNSISAVIFSVDYDENWLSFDPTDSDEDGIPDAITFNLPMAFQGSVTFDGADTDGELDFFIADLFPPLSSLTDRTLVYITFNVGSPSQSTEAAVNFSQDPAASFGNTLGQSVQGTTDNGSVYIGVPVEYYCDNDGDGYKDVSVDGTCTGVGCQPAGCQTTAGNDCNDSDASVHPGATETCNGKDDNCNGQTDEEGSQGCTTYYYDNDSDGYGVTANTKCLCSASGKYTATQGNDCNDSDASVHPGATETCNGKDDDCNGQTDEEGSTGCTTYYYDNDGDGYGVTGNTKCLCSASGKYTATQGGDCNDSDASVHPGATETCNGKDDNCDGQTDEEGSQGCTTYYYDNDSDGYGVTGNTKCLCAPSGKYTATQGGDCNDSDASVHPGATETCNGKDDNCNGQTDEEGSQGCTTYYYDNDGDGYGVTGNTKCLCAPSGKYTATQGGDCNDNDASVHPGATETCNGKDDNCDGQTDEEGSQGCTTYYYDNDGDGYGVTGNTKCLCAASGKYTATQGGDCNDSDASVHPGATETCNGKDDNCNGQTDEEGSTGCTTYYYDNDGDGYGVTANTKCLCSASGKYTATQGGDCNDSDASVHPGATETCNGKDDNCNGQTDEEGSQGCTTYYYDNDGDGYGVTGNTKCLCAPSGKYTATQGGDCNDSDASVNPGATEICDGKDNDCNAGTADGSGESWFGQPTSCGVGVCGRTGQFTCSNGSKVNTCVPGNPTETPEVSCSDGLDNDCDGAADSADTADCGQVSYYCDNDSDGYKDISVDGTCTGVGCQPAGCQTTPGNDCNDNDASVHPGAVEICDGKDNDCNAGTADGSGESWFGSPTSCGVGVCGRTGQFTCTAGTKVDTCTPGNPTENPEISCRDGLDNDCDGFTDLADQNCQVHDLAIKQLRTPGKARDCGSNKTLSITVINNGTQNETGDLVLKKNGTPICTWPNQTFGSGKSKSTTLSCIYNFAGDGGTTISWQAEVSIPNDGVPSNNIMSDTTAVVRCL